MLSKVVGLVLMFSILWISTSATVKVGLISKKGDRDSASVIKNVFNSYEKDFSISSLELLEEIADEEDIRSYHRALCRLLASGVDAFISPAESPYYSVLSDYANEYQIPFIAPELPQTISAVSNNYSFGIRPSTTRAMLRLFQLYRWRDVVYLYDNDDGPENLSFMFAVGSRAVGNLTLDGLLKVTSAEEANKYLQRLDKTFKHKSFHVILDMDSDVAHEIIRRHVNDIQVRKRNFHFVLSKPILEQFWNTQMVTFGAVNVTAFVITSRLPSQESFKRPFENDVEQNLNINLHYYYDAAVVLIQGIRRARYPISHPTASVQPQFYREVEGQPTNCLDKAPTPSYKGAILSKTIKQTRILGATGRIEFSDGHRTKFAFNITEVTSKGFNRIGLWSDGNLYGDSSFRRKPPTTLPLIQTNSRLQIVSIINPPYLMLKTGENATFLQGNDRFEGYCKDMIDLLAQEMKFEYDIHLVNDGMYGRYDKSTGKWNGMIGELIQGKADLAVTDLTITGQRHRVVDFTDPFQLIGFSLVMKNPRSTNLSSMKFFLSAFTVDVWICILFTMLIFCVLFHMITKFTGAPDSIESASGIWGRKHAVVVNLWFVAGSSLFQGTGVYPRSISSRILSGFCWFFTIILSSLFIASIVTQIVTGRQGDENSPQLSQLRALSMEAIISESVSRGWPKIGLVRPSWLYNYIKKSNIPIYVEYAKYLENHHDVIVRSEDEGIKRVRESRGGYMVMLESLISEYTVRRKPCDVITTHHSVHYAGYGLATPLGSSITSELNKALHAIQGKGELGDLHRKWWIDSSECKNFIITDNNEGSMHTFSGLLCVSAFGFLILIVVFAIQCIRRNQSKENRRQQLSFEDMNLGQTLPTPPPELLAEPAPVLNLPEYDKRTLL